MENSFSRYRNIRSLIHSIDPLTKLVAFIMLSFASILSQSFLTIGVTLGFVLIVAILARVRFSSYFKILLFIIPFFISMYLMYLLVYWLQNDPELYMTTLTVVGRMSIRLYLFLLLSIIYTSTTKEMEIANSIAWLIHPLSWIKVPTYEISIMIMLAIRFIPLMLEDLRKISIAQTSRGHNIYNGTTKTKVKGIGKSLLPMLIIAFQRSEDVANALTIRGYEPGMKRVKYVKNRFGILEFIAIALVILLLVFLIGYPII